MKDIQHFLLFLFITQRTQALFEKKAARRQKKDDSVLQAANCSGSPPPLMPVISYRKHLSPQPELRDPVGKLQLRSGPYLFIGSSELDVQRTHLFIYGCVAFSSYSKQVVLFSVFKSTISQHKSVPQNIRGNLFNLKSYTLCNEHM